MNRRFRKLGLTCNVGAECEFYLFENDDRGCPTRIPIDFGGYFDVARWTQARTCAGISA